MMGQLFSYGIDKLAKPNLELALKLWDSQKKTFVLDGASSQRIEQRWALVLAVRRDPRVFERLKYVSQPDEELKCGASARRCLHKIGHTLSKLMEQFFQ